MFFLTFSSLFSLTVYLVRFNSNNQRHFLNICYHVCPSQLFYLFIFPCLLLRIVLHDKEGKDNEERKEF